MQEAGCDGYSGPVGVRQLIAGRSTVERAEANFRVMAKGLGIACAIIIILLLLSRIVPSSMYHRMVGSKE